MYKEKNQGICLLRIILAYEVIMCHFYNSGGILAHFKTFAVPCFFIISFFYSADMIIHVRTEKVRKKIIRLIIPFWTWGIIYYIFNGVIMKKAVPLDLLWQMITGSSNAVNPPLWFMADQIAILFILYGIYSLCANHKHGNIAIIIFMVLCVFLQYSGINLQVFDELPWELKWNMGRLAEVFPFAAIGILLYQLINRKEVSKLNKMLVYIFSACILIGLYKVNIPNGYGFGYEGMAKIVGACAIVVIFYMLPIKENKILEKISSCTLGIYCLHWGIGSLLKEFLVQANINVRESILCVAIFAVSLIMSMLISYIPIKGVERIVS